MIVQTAIYWGWMVLFGGGGGNEEGMCSLVQTMEARDYIKINDTNLTSNILIVALVCKIRDDLYLKNDQKVGVTSSYGPSIITFDKMHPTSYFQVTGFL